MISRVTYSALALLATTAVAAAQTYEVVAPKVVSAEQSLLWEWIYGLVFVVGCLVVAFKPAKRSNLQ
jgi:FtsH-binding integral membrane protein